MAKPQTAPQTSISTSLQDILDRPSSEVERPKPLPVGSYTCIIKGLPNHGESSKKKTPFVEFLLGIQEARDDVDEEELSAWMEKPDGSTRSLTDATMRVTFYKTEDALWRLTDFLDNCEAGDDTMTIRERIDETPNCSVVAYVRHRPSEDGSTIFAEVAKTAPVEA